MANLTLKQLRSLEYAGVHSWGYEENGCPVCGAQEDTPHNVECWLNKKIQEERQKEGAPA